MPKPGAWLLFLVAATVALGGGGCAGASTRSAARILFVSDRTGAWALYSMQPDGRDERRVLGEVGHVDPGAE